MGYFMILLLILIMFAAVAVFISRRFAPSKEQADLLSYYNLTERESSNRQAAGTNELAIVIDDTILDNSDTAAFRAILDGNDVYVGISLVQDYIDGRFYLDNYEDLVVYTNAVDSIVLPIDSSVYRSGGNELDAGYVIAKTIGSDIYLNMNFVSDHSSVSYQVFQDPARVYIRNDSGDIETITAKENIKMRSSDDRKASIVTVVPKGSQLKVLSKSDGWLEVIDDQGFTGYVQDNFISDITSQTLSSDYQEPAYTHLTLDGSVNMVWHGIYYYESNQYISDYTYDMTGVNVLAPTWFLFADNYGDILSYANQYYIDYAHDNGWYVWAVLEDMDGESSVEILPYTSRRQTAISQMINECLTYGIDGINVDLETVTSSLGTDFIQFIRELSAACRNNGLILSVADYAPYAYNAYRHTQEQSKLADYVAIMAYDDYVGGSEAGPNASLPFLSEVMELCRNTVDMDRLIIGLPFYSRAWYEYGDGSLGSDTMDMNGVKNLIWNYDLTTEWNADLGYDYVEYESDGTTVKLWCENTASLQAKLELLQQYNIAGIACWRLGQETSDVWAVLSQYY